VLLHHRDTDPMQVVAICSAGLTHRPNLDLKALNRAGAPPEDIMKDLLIKLLGLKADASDAEIVAAVNSLKADHDKALNAAQTPDPARFVPKAQHEETVAALNTARADLAARDTADKSARADKLVDDAIAGGKLVPAVRDHYVGLALNNYEGTKAALDAMPSILAAGSGTVPVADPATGAVLTADEKAMCSRLGLAEQDYLKARAA
jgi:phage I-like protein